MSLKQRLATTPPGTEFIEPKPIDINDYYTRRSNADTYSGLKPSLKPLKMSNAVRRKSQRDFDVDALEASQKRIIYIQTFNHVKNEAIVTQPDNNMAKTAYKIPTSPDNKKRNVAGDKKKLPISLESQLTISFFKKNNKKFNPQKIIKKKPESIDLKGDENSPAPKDFAFLTGVNLQESDPPKQDDENEGENDLVEQDEYEFVEHEAVLRELQPTSISHRPDEPLSKETTDRQRSAKEQNRLPTLKKPATANSDRPAVSVSEARYKQYMNQKPKMYITAKTNSIQAFGRPADYKEHLTRVYNKEATPVVPYAWVDHLGPRKDIKKAILESYLAQYSLEALKYIDEDLYEYAKENMV